MTSLLDLRLRQLHASLDQVVGGNIAEVKTYVHADATHYYASVDFSGGKSLVDILNIVDSCIENIARLKDHLKAWCAESGKPFEGDKLIDSNRDVAIIHDLWNRAKHAVLTGSRSGLHPELRKVGRAARLTTQGRAGSWAGITMDPRSGQLNMLGDARVSLEINAEVVDSKGALIGSLTDIVERAVSAWEQTLVVAGVRIPQRIA